MFFGFGLHKKTIKELRKNQGLTAKELAQLVKVETVKILQIEDTKLRDVPEPLKTRLIPFLRGDYMNKIPW